MKYKIVQRVPRRCQSPSAGRAWIEIESDRVAVRLNGSPSAGRAWIEIRKGAGSPRSGTASPSAGRAWIEISHSTENGALIRSSPSAGRAWIEIYTGLWIYEVIGRVALRGEGVD